MDISLPPGGRRVRVKGTELLGTLVLPPPPSPSATREEGVGAASTKGKEDRRGTFSDVGEWDRISLPRGFSIRGADMPLLAALCRLSCSTPSAIREGYNLCCVRSHLSGP